MKEIKIGTKKVNAIWTKEMHEDLINFQFNQEDFEKNLISTITAAKRRIAINKIFKSTN
jgi:3-dehydroquinate dehydratase